MKFSNTLIGLVMLWFHTVRLWLLPNMMYCKMFSSACSCKHQWGKHCSQISYAEEVKLPILIALKQHSFWQVYRGLSLHIWHQLESCTPSGLRGSVLCWRTLTSSFQNITCLSDLPLARWLKRRSCHRFDPTDKCCPLTTTYSVKVSLSRTLNYHLLTQQSVLASCQLKLPICTGNGDEMFFKADPWPLTSLFWCRTVHVYLWQTQCPCSGEDAEAFLELCLNSPVLSSFIIPS